MKVNPEAISGIDYNGNTPLHDAAKTFNYEAIQKLLLIKMDLGRVRNFKGAFTYSNTYIHTCIYTQVLTCIHSLIDTY